MLKGGFRWAELTFFFHKHTDLVQIRVNNYIIIRGILLFVFTYLMVKKIKCLNKSLKLPENITTNSL